MTDPSPTLCVEHGCLTPAVADSTYCADHDPTQPPCAHSGCLRHAWPGRRDYCMRHYMQRRRAGVFTEPEAPPDSAPDPAPTPPPAPAPVTVGPDVTALAGTLATALAGALADPRVLTLQAQVTALATEIDRVRREAVGTYRIEVRAGAPVPPPPDAAVVAHYLLPTVTEVVAAGIHVMLVGPAGSGKTYLAQQVATALGRPFFATNAVSHPMELMGWRDAGGSYHGTPLEQAYVAGGVFLWDEIDASDPAALVAFNAALSNGHASFGDGLQPRHGDFVAIGCANTYGRGADRQYVGRNQLDAATLDRYAVLTMDYDERLEQMLCGVEPDVPAQQPWSRRPSSDSEIRAYVADLRTWRARIAELGIRHILSPRAAIYGSTLLRRGVPRSIVEDACCWKGLDTAQVAKIKAGA